MTHVFPKIRSEEKLAHRVINAVVVSGLSRATIYKLLNAGKLPPTKVGGRRLILCSAHRKTNPEYVAGRASDGGRYF